MIDLLLPIILTFGMFTVGILLSDVAGCTPVSTISACMVIII